MKKWKKWTALMLSLSMIAGTVALPAQTVRAAGFEQDVTGQNLVKNPSFKEDGKGWTFTSGAGIAGNNAHDNDNKHFYLDASNSAEFAVSQKIWVPAGGTYSASIWACTGGTGGTFGIRKEDGTILKTADITGNSYAQYTLDDLALDGGQKVEIYVTAATAWVNGDEFSFACTEQTGEAIEQPWEEPDYNAFSGNMVKNPSFDESSGWTFVGGGGYASNNGHNGNGDRHFNIGTSMSQEIAVPYTGYYKAGLWVCTSMDGAKFVLTNLTTEEVKETDIAMNSLYTYYESSIWLNRGDTVEIKVTRKSGWVNGDDISLEYDTSNFVNMVVNPEFSDDSAWEITEGTQIVRGSAVLTGADDSIAQGIYIPQDGPYYVEVTLEDAEGATVSFGDKKEEHISGSKTVKIDNISLTTAQTKTDDLVNLSVSGKATVKKAVVQFDLDNYPNNAPSVSDVSVTGDCTVDVLLGSSYTFRDEDGHSEGNSEFRWLVADAADGEYTEIPGATSRNLFVKEEWEDKYLKFEVTPVDQYAKAGTAVQSPVVGPVDLNIIQEPGFESNGRNWSGIGMSNKDAHTGLVRAIISPGTTGTQTLTVPRSAYYNLVGWVRHNGAGGSIGIQDEAGNDLGSTQAPPAVSGEDPTWRQAEVKGIPLEEGQKVKVALVGADADDEDAAAYDADTFSLKRDRDKDMPTFRNVKTVRTTPEAFETVVDNIKKEIRLVYLYGTDTTKIKLDELTISEGASASIQTGMVLDLSGDMDMTVTGSDGTQDTWKIVSETKEKKVSMTSSNKNLENTFNWAANKMDQFVMTGKTGLVNKSESNAAGTGTAEYIPSYWAGYYDRTAFYTRDFVHQATGAQIAGLTEENYTMFNAFAKECNELRKWYTVWALNFDGSVYTLDYNNENSFVREVPAQFELVEKAYKQYLWSGDDRYIQDEDLWNFYTNVMTKYIDTHDANENGVAQEVGTGIFNGSCTYNERGGRTVIEAGDAIGSQYQATLAYAGMLKARGEEEESKAWYQKAADLKKYFNEEWSQAEEMESEYVCAWGPNGERYSDFSKETSWFIPLKMITEPGERNDGYIDFLLEKLGDGIGSSSTAPSNIEAYTYIPDMLFLYNRSDDAWKWMKYIASIKDNPHERPSQGTNGDYPEISFTYVSHVIEGMMGVEPDAWEDRVATSPRLPSEVDDMKVDFMKIGDYEIDLEHIGNTQSTLTNNGKKAITWEARFYGDYEQLQAGDSVIDAETKDINGITVSYVTVEVPAGESITVKADADADDTAKKAAKAVDDMIDALGEITLEKKADVEAARAAYEALDNVAKGYVTKLDVLVTAEGIIAQLEASNDEIEEAKEAAKAVDDAIDALGEITWEKKAAVGAARKAYDELSALAKSYVTKLDILRDAEAKLEELEDQDQSIKDAAKAVDDQIDALGEITLEKKTAVEAARAAYEALSEAAKGYVTKLDVLKAAEKKITELQNQDAADRVAEMIRKLGTITASSKADIEAARAAYNALSDAAKALVPNLNVLKAAEQKYAEITNPATPSKTDLAKATVAAIPAQAYNGKALTPALTVSCNGKNLTLNKDYTAAYRANQNIGTASVEIRGIGDYTGSKTVTFQIVVKKKAVYTVGNYKYTITNAKTNGKGTVALSGVKSKSVANKLKKITVAKTVNIGGKKFNVTEISAKAFSTCKKAASATIGANVTKIGANAFNGCKNLKKVTISSKNLKSVGKNAFKNISAKAKIKVPKNKLKAYKKLLSRKGQKKSVKITS